MELSETLNNTCFLTKSYRAIYLQNFSLRLVIQHLRSFIISTISVSHKVSKMGILALESVGFQVSHILVLNGRIVRHIDY